MKALRYLSIACVCLFLSSCADFLDKAPDDMLTLEMVFKDKTRTEDWLAGIYTAIPETWGYFHEEAALSDDMAPSTGWQKYGWGVIGLQVGNWNPTSGYYWDYWNDLPKRVRSALIFIENVKANETQKVTQAEVELMKLEARFLIAYYYASRPLKSIFQRKHLHLEYFADFVY